MGRLLDKLKRGAPAYDVKVERDGFTLIGKPDHIDEFSDIVREAAEQAAAENLVAARKGITPGDDALLQSIEKSGVTITRLTPEQRQAFKDATRPVYDKWAATIGKDLVKKAETAIANIR